MTLPPNPYRPGSYEHQYFNARKQEIESTQDRHEFAMGEGDPEIVSQARMLTQRMVGEIEPSHGHIGVNARIDLQARANRAAMIHENRGDLREPAPEPEMVHLDLFHKTAGRLNLRTDGVGWWVHIRGMDYGIGDVRRGEITKTTVKPRSEVIEAAVARAFADPWGPPAPPDSPVFTDGPDGEPIERRLADFYTEGVQQPDRDTIQRLRHTLTRRKTR